MLSYMSINSIMFNVPIVNYPMSFIEFFGTIFNLWSVILASKNKISNFPVGIIGCVLFIIIFFQVTLYSDMILNIVFIVMSVYGMYVWKHPKTVEDKNGINELKIRRSSVYGIFSYSVTILIGTYLLGSVMSNIHNVFPKIFISPASYPYWDAFVTTSSIVAMYLMSKRLYDCWFLWFTLDVVCIVLFYSKGIQFISLLYFVFLFTAIIGLRTWWKVMKDEGSNETK